MLKRTRGQRSTSEILASDWRNAMKLLPAYKSGVSKPTPDEVLYEHEEVTKHAQLMLSRLIAVATPAGPIIPEKACSDSTPLS